MASQPEVPPLREVLGGWEFESFIFAYADKRLLQDVTLNLTHGQKLGIAGENGSGKSTLVNLLFCL